VQEFAHRNELDGGVQTYADSAAAIADTNLPSGGRYLIVDADGGYVSAYKP
jgi:hypothetical protein